MTTAANSITFYAPEEFFLSSYFFIASKIRETMRKNWEAFMSHLYADISRVAMGMLSTL